MWDIKILKLSFVLSIILRELFMITRIILVNLWESGINSWYWRCNFTKEKSWRENIFKWENLGVDSSSDDKTWRENIFKWCKKLGVDSSSDNYNLELRLVKKYNTQDRYGTWGVNVGLLNHVKNWVWKFSPLPIYFKYFNYIIGYYVYFLIELNCIDC